MTSHNIALLSKQEQRDIELQRIAALLMYKFKRGAITRAKVESAILKIPSQEREKFKGFLNSFKSNKGKSKAKTKDHKNDGSAKAKEWLNNVGNN